jgi:hypothetical protein
VIPTNATYPWSSLAQIFRNGKSNHDYDRYAFDAFDLTTRNLWFSSFFVSYNLVEQKLHTLPEHLSFSPVFSGVRVTRSLVLCNVL